MNPSAGPSRIHRRHFVALLAFVVAVVAGIRTPPAMAQDGRPDSSGTPGRAPVEQDDIAMEAALPAIVVTATRAGRDIKSLPVPTSLIAGDVVSRQASLRLTDVLQRHPGLQVVYDHGAGIQIQGLASDYTLILVDGEPLIGRVAGTLDLDRVSVAAIDRIEIVRGPSSSLYGSEALAGVVNVITKAPESRWSARVRSQYETHQTSDVAIEAETASEDGSVGARVYGTRYASAGYDLSPLVVGMTSPGFVDYTGGGKVRFGAGTSRTRGELSIRANVQDQTDDVLLSGDDSEVYEQFGRRKEISVAPELTHRLTPEATAVLSLYGSTFDTRTDTRSPTTTQEAASSSELVSRALFEQRYAKAELLARLIPSTMHLVTASAGFVHEHVEADRIAGGSRSSRLGYAFVQHEWLSGDALDVISSVRLDHHSEYGTHVSPRVAALVSPGRDMRVRAALGSGFKAPTFQQLYLDFTNPAAGYSVFGSADAAGAIRMLDEAGIIQTYLQDIENVELAPETSWSLNAGIEKDLQLAGSGRRPGAQIGLRVNFFRNHVSNLIEAAPVALKTNGQSVFTYYNLNKIVTQGIEFESTILAPGGLHVTASYTYLDSFDCEVVDEIKSGNVFRREGLRDVRVTRSEYGGLANRSRHMATLGLARTFAGAGTTADVHVTYRGRYGFGDLNGNLIVDDDSEYVDGYFLLDATVSQNLGSHLVLRGGGRNLLDHSDPTRIPSLSGRRLLVALELII